ncbi:MAG: pantetheine-phosphate adenylyltransferase [Porphyromonas sp.]|nr:pantetheine-phosphate adenylyltransferase [Porphyromonas sp.]
MERSKHHIGVYAGSFDPFTIGHDDIVRRALSIVDELHIVVGVNIHKGQPFQPLDERLATIRHLYEGEPHIVVTHHEGITAKYALTLDGAVLIRGIRTASDLEQERAIADVNRNHFGVETLFLLADPRLAMVSSTLVRELAAFGERYDEYLPH